MDIRNPLHYIAANNPEGVAKVLERYNIPIPRYEREYYDAVDLLLAQYGREAAEDIFALHPDAQDILTSKRFSGARGPISSTSDPIKVPKLNTDKPSDNGNGNGNGVQDRWILITLLLIAVFALGRWFGGSK